METLLPTKTDFALWDGITWLAADRSHSLYLYVALVIHQSILYNYILHDCVPKPQDPPPKAETAFIVLLLHKMYYMWKLLLSVASPTFLSDI